MELFKKHTQNKIDHCPPRDPGPTRPLDNQTNININTNLILPHVSVQTFISELKCRVGGCGGLWGVVGGVTTQMILLTVQINLYLTICTRASWGGLCYGLILGLYNLVWSEDGSLYSFFFNLIVQCTCSTRLCLYCLHNDIRWAAKLIFS